MHLHFHFQWRAAVSPGGDRQGEGSVRPPVLGQGQLTRTDGERVDREDGEKHTRGLSVIPSLSLCTLELL